MKTMKRGLSFLLALVMVLGMVPSTIHTHAEEAGDLSATIDTGASVTLKDTDSDGYYDIGTADELYAFAAAVNSGNTVINGELTANIVVNENVLNANGDGSNFRAWAPIGNKSNHYIGTFDGGNHTVSGLYLRMKENYLGLFGMVGSGGKVQNVGVINSYISAASAYSYEGVYSGGVAGYNYGTVTNCYNMGSIAGNNYCGGVVGYNNTGTVTNCYNTGHVWGSDDSGGVVGYNIRGTVANCYNAGFIQGIRCVGGVVGYNVRGTVANCWSKGYVSGSSYVGGVIGQMFGGSENHASHCYYDKNICSLSAIGYGSGTVTDVVGKTTEQFASGEVAYLLGDAFGQNIDNGNSVQGYPVLGGAKVFAINNCLNELIRYSNVQDDDILHVSSEQCTICPCGADFHNYDYYTQKCSLCGTGCTHSFDGGICTKCGYYCEHDWDHNKMQYYSVCTICDLLCGHSYHETYRMEATCSAQGVVNYKCAFCTSEKIEILDALGHDFVGDYTDTTHTGECRRCDYVSTGFHEYSREYFDPTCTEDGYYTDTCTGCGYSKKTVTGTKLNHYGGEATCKELAVCERCGEGYGEIGNHVGGEATCTELAICDVCGEDYGELKRHESDLDDSDCTTPVRCSVCGAVTKEANATHTWGEDNFCSNENCQETRGFTFTFTYGDEVLFVRNVHTGNFYTFEGFEERDGLTLVGWDADDDGEVDYNIGDYTYVEGDLSFNAVYKLVYTVRFITYDIWENKYTESFNPIMGEANQTVTLRDDASPYFKFLGWATEEGGGVVYEANEEITLTQNLILYSVIRPYRATFELGEGAVWNDENGNPITVLEGNYSGDWIEIRKFPTRIGYIFKGFTDQTEWLWEPWQDEDTGEWVVDFYFDRADLEMTAVWEECTAHNYENSVCTICGTVCEHEYENGHCTICDEMCEHGFVDGICAVCGMECDHTFDDEGVCTVCGMECDHTFDDEGVCTVCGTVCEHADQTGETCLVCGAALHIHTLDDRGQTCKGYWCTGCEEWYGEANPNAHNYVGKVTAEPTCDTAGMMTYTCGSCGDTYTEEIPAYHNNNLEYHPKKDPIDCATPGNNEYWYCPGCYEYFADAYAEEYINPWYIDLTMECARPEGLADCANFICEICETENWGYGEHDVLDCKGGTCSKCREEIEGFGCQNYDTPACEDGLCYYCGGFVAGFGHENGAWAPCTDGKCSYGCGLAYPAAEDHVDEDSDDYCDNCWNHLYHVAPDEDEYDPCSGYDCLICWAWVDGQHTGGDATCQSGPICEVCSNEYGEPDPDNHAEGCSCVIEETTVTVDFYSLSLKGNIGINFYMDIPESIAADETGYMAFTTPRGGEVKIPIAQADVRTVDGKKYYRFTATVAAKEMTDVITGQYFYGEGQSEVFSYSVQQYAQQVIDYEGTDGNMLKLKPLAEAMLNYGAWAQKNFGYNTDKLAAEVSAIDSVTVDTLSGYARTGAQGTAAAPLESVSLILETETSMRLYFTTTAELTATMNGEALKVVRKSAGECYVEIPNISAKNLDDTFTIVIHDGTEEATVTYCPMTYCYNVLVAGTAVVSEDMVNTAKALYLYNQAANIYFQ